MQKFSYYQFVKEAAMQKQAFKMPGRPRSNGGRGTTVLNKAPIVSPQFGVVGQTVTGARRKGVLEGATDDVRAYGRLAKRQGKKLLAAVQRYAAQTGTSVDAVLKQLKNVLGTAADKAKGAAGAAGSKARATAEAGKDALVGAFEKVKGAAGSAGSKAKATAEAGKDALIGAYEKAKPAVQEAGQKALAWLGSHRQGLRDAGLGALLFDAVTDED